MGFTDYLRMVMGWWSKQTSQTAGGYAAAVGLYVPGANQSGVYLPGTARTDVYRPGAVAATLEE